MISNLFQNNFISLVTRH